MDTKIAMLKPETFEIFEKYVIGKMKGINSFEDIDYNSISDVLDYLVDEYECPLANNENNLTKDERKTLDEVADAVTDITTQPWW